MSLHKSNTDSEAALLEIHLCSASRSTDYINLHSESFSYLIALESQRNLYAELSYILILLNEKIEST